MRVAFDCDGTLLNLNGSLNDGMCRLLIGFIFTDAKVTVWSGGGKSYASNVWRKIAYDYNLLEDFDIYNRVECKMKDDSKPDLTFDDQFVNLGTINVCVDLVLHPKLNEQT